MPRTLAATPEDLSRSGAHDTCNGPLSAANFIFAIILEEYGLVGGIVVALLYLIFLTRGGIIVRICTRTYPAFLATGAVSIIILQAMINMGVSSGALPVTGQLIVKLVGICFFF